MPHLLTSRPADTGDLKLPRLELGDPMVRFMVELRDAIERESQLRANEKIRGLYEAAWPEVARGLMKLLDTHKPEAAMANLQRVYMGEPDRIAPKPASGPTRDELKLSTSPDCITGLEGLKSLVDPYKPETIVRLAEMYLKFLATEHT